MNEVIEKIKLRLRESADEKTRESSKRFFREEVIVYGVKTAITSTIAKEVFSDVRDFTKAEVFQLCEELWKSGYLEESFIACNLAYRVKKQYGPADFAMFERWVDKYVKNWASCDTLCNHSVNAIIEKYPGYLQDLKRWAKSPNLWMRRASAVTLIVSAKRGSFLEDIFEIADILLEDKEDMVQKGYGWMLKAASQANQIEVFNYVIRNKKVMPRTALRYAIEKMPAELKRRAMEKA